jgi:HAE1 family hydrophobic/amphiphilic exporter-1
LRTSTTGGDASRIRWQLVKVGRELFPILREAAPEALVRPVPVLDDGSPELHLAPRQEDALRLGFSIEDVGWIPDAYIDGAIIGEFGREGEANLDFVLMGHPI